MARRLRLSLANKCQVLFGLAVLLIILAALGVVWQRFDALNQAPSQERARALAQWAMLDWKPGTGETEPYPGVQRLSLEQTEPATKKSPWVQQAVQSFNDHPDRRHLYDRVRTPDGQYRFRYARAVRDSDLMTAEEARALADTPRELRPPDPMQGIILIEFDDRNARQERTANLMYLVAAGLAAGLLAIAVFWFITTRIILSPVRTLRRYAQKASEGDLGVRSDINTGDEFEQLSNMFNTMLANLKANQDQLRAANMSLDLKLGELAESNVSLFEANRIKGDFLANVSHELRTPLNSIIGFGEMLEETLRDRTGPVDEKRKRYIANIIRSSKQLLDLINDLLDLAKIEAGRVSVNVSQVSVNDTCEGLINLMKPEAQKKNVTLKLRVEPGLPVLQTDAGKLQQVLFNLLSNAVKFTPGGGRVSLIVTLIPSIQEDEPASIRFEVQDTGPGIAQADHAAVFEKFNQLDPSVTREHGGTGLGLAISRELADMLQGQLDLDSQPGHGATFSLTIPVAPKSRTNVLMPESA